MPKPEEKKSYEDDPKVKDAISRANLAIASASSAAASFAIACGVAASKSVKAANVIGDVIQTAGSIHTITGSAILATYFMKKGIDKSNAKKAAEALAQANKDEAFAQAFTDIYD